MTQETYGETLYKGIGSGYVYTPWMPCRGDKAVFVLEILKITSGLTLAWNIETKNKEQADADAVALMTPSDQSETSPGTKYSMDGGANPTELENCLELYRFRISTGSGFSTSEFVNLRVLQPAWSLDGR